MNGLVAQQLAVPESLPDFAFVEKEMKLLPHAQEVHENREVAKLDVIVQLGAAGAPGDNAVLLAVADFTVDLEFVTEMANVLGFQSKNKAAVYNLVQLACGVLGQPYKRAVQAVVEDRRLELESVVEEFPVVLDAQVLREIQHHAIQMPASAGRLGDNIPAARNRAEEE